MKVIQRILYLINYKRRPASFIVVARKVLPKPIVLSFEVSVKNVYALRHLLCRYCVQKILGPKVFSYTLAYIFIEY